MERKMAYSNALGIFNYLCTMHPDWLSSFTNYECCYEITTLIPDTYERLKEEIKVLGAMLLEGVEMEQYYNLNIKRECLLIHWRSLK